MPFSDTDNGIDLKGNNGNTLIANFPTPVKTEGVAYVPGDEDAANLQLIAAAPELLEALEKAVEMLEPSIRKMSVRKNFTEINTFENQLKKALAKAKAVNLP